MRSLGKAAVVLLISLGLSACVNQNNYGEDAGSTKSLKNLWSKFSSVDSEKKGLLANNTVYYGFDKYGLDEKSKEVLQAHAEFLLSHPDSKLRIEGHTDPAGSANYNVGLGDRRAKSVSNYLVLKGVSPSQIAVVSYGKEKLAVNDSTDEAARLNRRSEMFYEAE